MHAAATRIFPGSPKSGVRLRVPGDKSISHRVAMLGGIATGRSIIHGFLKSDDCLRTLTAMEALGCRYKWENDALVIDGTGGRLHQPEKVLDMGNSGTGLRLLAGLVAGSNVKVTLTGDESLRSRPMKRIKDPLELMGARVALEGEGGTPPVTVAGGGLHGIGYELPVASAQVKSCILLAGLFAQGETIVREPIPSRDHTERIMRALGLPVLRPDELTVRLRGFGGEVVHIPCGEWHVPGDISSAAFLIALVAGYGGCRVSIDGVGLNPRRTVFLEILRKSGVGIETEASGDGYIGEPRGILTVEGAHLKGMTIEGHIVPGLIDEIPMLAALGAIAEGVTIIRDASELRVKEADRIKGMCINLERLGVHVEEYDDGMVIHGAQRIEPKGVLDSYGDHRIAMSLAVLASHASAPVVITNTSCISTSYPEFWDDLLTLGIKSEHIR